MLITVKPEPENKTFPQANDIHKLIKYVDEKTFNYHYQNLRRVSLEYVERQKSYYKSAANYLGLLKGSSSTELALHIFKKDKNEVLIDIVQLILKNQIFFNYYKYKNIDETKNMLMQLYGLSYSTADRRTSTVKAWIDWCEHIIKENNISIEIKNKEHK